MVPDLRQSPVPLLDSSFLPGEEDWAVVEALHGANDGFDPDEDRYSGLGLAAGDFD
jgi:hypothetical protein